MLLKPISSAKILDDVGLVGERIPCLATHINNVVIVLEAPILPNPITVAAAIFVRQAQFWRVRRQKAELKD
jgi:hypothetical protein